MDYLEVVRHKYSDKSYNYWKECIGKDPIIEKGPSGADFDVEVSPAWVDKPDGPIVVLVSESSHRLLHWNMRSITFIVPPCDGDR